MESRTLDTVIGFAWFIHGTTKAPWHALGDDVLLVGCLNGEEVGIQNFSAGHTYLMVTQAARPPDLPGGWMVEPAELDDHFFQVPGNGLRLVRIIRDGATAMGSVQYCEFEAVHGDRRSRAP